MQQGKDKTLFFIHGMWGGPWYWQDYIDFLERAGYRCLTTTLRHHDMRPEDGPDPRLGRVSMRDYAADLEGEIAALPAPPVLIGHSMGGLLAQMLAARRLARAAVLLAPAAPRGIRSLTFTVARSFARVLLRWGTWRKPMRLSHAASVYSMLHRMPAPAQRAICERMVYESGRAACEIGLWPFDTHASTAVDASAVTCPLLVIAGAEDRITPASVVRKVARKYPQAEYRELPGHAHWLVGEPGWEEIVGGIRDWLQRLPDQPERIREA